MLSAIQTLEQMDFDVTSTARAVQQVRQYVESAADPLSAAKRIIWNLFSINSAFVDCQQALHVVQYVVKDCITIDAFAPQDVIDSAFEKAKQLSIAQPWIRPSNSQSTAQPTVAVVQDLDVHVVVKDNGKIKKGGKQVLAIALYEKHCKCEKPLTNQEFVAVLMKELGMSKAGATTYAYNCRNVWK